MSILVDRGTPWTSPRGAPDLDALGLRLAEGLAGAGLTPSELAEVTCIALGIDGDLSAAARGVTPRTIRARRQQLRRKLARALASAPDRGPDPGSRTGAPPRSRPIR